MNKKRSNTSNSGCSPVSSNCVIWQGPNIDLIELQHGDSVSEVVFQLATKITELNDQLDLSEVDLKNLAEECSSCPTPDKSLKTVLNILIKTLDGITGGDGAEPDNVQLIDLPLCLQWENDYGKVISKMEPNDYLERIAKHVCGILSSIKEHQTVLKDHGRRLTALEEKEANEPFEDTVYPQYVAPKDKPMQVAHAWEVLEKQFGELREMTGHPNDLSIAAALQPEDLNTSPAFSANTVMSALPHWKSVTENLADVIGNMWITIGDIRVGLAEALKATRKTCNDIVIDFSILIDRKEGALNATLFFAGLSSIPDAFRDHENGSELLVFDNAGNSYTTYIQPALYKRSPDGIIVSLGNSTLSKDSTLTFVLQSNLTDGVSSCSKSAVKSVDVDNAMTGDSCPIPSNLQVTYS